jgi:3-methyladenine DNA glycosylase AlkD
MPARQISPKARDLQKQLRALGNPKDAEFLQRFFKTGPGQYGEGDAFIGLRVPVVRKAVVDYAAMPLREVEILLHSEIHEERLAALVILTLQAKKAGEEVREQLYNFYLANTRHINNWDLVDISAPHIIGAYLEKRNRAPLRRLARSTLLWDRRIAIVATFHFIRLEDFADTLGIAEMLLSDKQDLIHKATGWMLREVGKREVNVLEAFLDRHSRAMPRTMLRYAIEKLPEERRTFYLAAK